MAGYGLISFYVSVKKKPFSLPIDEYKNIPFASSITQNSFDYIYNYINMKTSQTRLI